MRALPSVRDGALLAMLAAAVTLLVAVWNPVLSTDQTLHRQLLVFDITQSMNVVDRPIGPAPPTRLDVARRSALEAMAKMPCGSEVGLGLFTGHRTLVLFAPVEVCGHYGDMAATIDAIDWRMAWEARSEVAKGLHSALLAAGDLTARTSVVFVTDGHEAPPLHPELRPRFRGTVGKVRGAVAGVGGEHLMPIPKLDSEGRRRGFWGHDDVLQVDTVSLGRIGASAAGDTSLTQDQVTLRRRIAAGTEHLSSLKEDYLRQLAAGLALEYARVSDAEDMHALLLHPRLGRQRTADLALGPVLGALALAVLVVLYLWAALQSRRGGARPPARAPR